MTVKISRNHFYLPKQNLKTLKYKLQSTKQLTTKKLIKKKLFYPYFIMENHTPDV